MESDRKALRRWLTLAIFGCAIIVVVFVVVLLVLVDKKHFGGLVGPRFLVVITSSVCIGALMVLIAAWNLPARWSWRGIALMAWALIALTSPLFGIMFLLPWGVLVLSLPLVIAILLGHHRATAQ